MQKIKVIRDIKYQYLDIFLNNKFLVSIPYIRRSKYKCNGTYEYAIPYNRNYIFGDICGHWVYPYSKFVKFVIYSNYFSKRYRLNDTMLTSNKDG